VNNAGHLNKLNKIHGIQVTKKKGIEVGTSQGLLSRDSKIQQVKTQVDSSMLNPHILSQGAGSSRNANAEGG